jgi:hypothetical protein
MSRTTRTSPLISTVSSDDALVPRHLYHVLLKFVKRNEIIVQDLNSVQATYPKTSLQYTTQICNASDNSILRFGLIRDQPWIPNHHYGHEVLSTQVTKITSWSFVDVHRCVPKSTNVIARFRRPRDERLMWLSMVEGLRHWDCCRC